MQGVGLRLLRRLGDGEIFEPSTEEIARQIVIPILVAANEAEIFEPLQGIVTVRSSSPSEAKW